MESHFATLWEAISDEIEHHRVGNELSLVHERLRLLAQRGPFPHRRPENVSGGDGGNAVVLGQKRSLSALAASGRSEQEHDQPLVTHRVTILAGLPAPSGLDLALLVCTTH